MRRVWVDREAPQRDAIAEAAKWIAHGRVVALPTDTLYGLAADPFQPGAIARLVGMKGRPEGRALPLIAADMDQVTVHFGRLSPLAGRLAGRFWPGPLTLLVPAPPRIAHDVSAGTGRVGVRVPAHLVAQAVCRAAGIPLTATSANLSGQPPAASPDEVEQAFGNTVDLLLDAGPTAGGAPSTLVDVTGDEPRLVRPGAIAWAEIQSYLAAA